MPTDLFAALSGLAAALAWGAADFGGGLATRRLPAFLAVLGSQGVGLAGVIVGVLVFGEAMPSVASTAWAAVAGIFGALGLAGLYRALADGRMGIVAPITGVLAAAIPVAVGIAMAGAPGPVRLIGFGVGLLAIVLASAADDGTTGRGGILLAVGAGLSFGMFYTCIGQVTEGLLAPLAISRASSVILVLVIVVAGRAPARAAARVGSRTLALVALVGVLDLAGNTAFLLAAQSGGLALAAVLGSLYPVATVVLAAALLREPIGRLHGAGVVAAAVAVVLIAGGG